MFLFCTSLKTDFSLTYSYILVLSDTFVFVKIHIFLEKIQNVVIF